MHRLFASCPRQADQPCHALHDITSLITSEDEDLTFLHTSWAQVALLAGRKNNSKGALPQTLICFNPLLLLGTQASLQVTRHHLGDNRVQSGAGNHNGIQLIVTEAGRVARLTPTEDCLGLPQYVDDVMVTAVASTNAGRVAAAVFERQSGQTKLLEFSSLGASDEDHDDTHSFWRWTSGLAEPLEQHIVPDEMVQLVATRAAYSARTAAGTVLTWAADARSTPPQMLGRDDPRASRPAPVACCEGLTVTSLSGCQGGQWVGAVTEAGDAFVWGGDASAWGDDASAWGGATGMPGAEPMHMGHEAEAGAVRVVLPERGLDEGGGQLGIGVADIAIGRDHVAVLDEEGKLWAWQRHESAGWRNITVPCGRIVKIAANEECIFAITEDDDENDNFKERQS